MRRDKRMKALLLAGLALLFVLAGMVFTAAACCHTCSGVHCPVCLQLRMWGTILRVFGVVLLCSFAAVSSRLAAWVRRAEILADARFSPVALKTKLQN